MIVNLSSYTYGSQNDENIPDSLSLFNKNVTELKRVFGDIPNIVVGDENPEDIASTLENGTVYIYIGEPVLTAESIGAIPTTSLGVADGVATLDSDGRLVSSQNVKSIMYVSDGATINKSHVGKFLCASTSSGAFTLTIAANSFDAGDEVIIFNSNLGTITIQGEEGVQLRGVNFSGNVEISTRFTAVSIKKWTTTTDGEEWFYVNGPGVGVPTLTNQDKIYPDYISSRVVSIAASSYTLSSADSGCFLLARNSSNYNQSSYTFNIPSNDASDLPIGTEISILRYYPGTVTITAASDTYLYCLGGSTATGASISIPNRYGCVKLKKIFADYWFAVGDYTSIS